MSSIAIGGAVLALAIVVGAGFMWGGEFRVWGGRIWARIRGGPIGVGGIERRLAFYTVPSQDAYEAPSTPEDRAAIGAAIEAGIHEWGGPFVPSVEDIEAADRMGDEGRRERLIEALRQRGV